jgi:hypothetical protein
MHVEFGDDVAYPVRGVGSISFQMPSSDVLFVLGLMNNLFSVSCIRGTTVHHQ